VGGAHVAAALAPAAASSAAPRTLALLLLAVVVGLIALRRRLGSAGVAATVAATWGCGFSAPTPRMAYTASSYSQLLLTSLVPRLLRPRVHLQAPRGIFPGRASFRTDPQDPARTRLFDPIFRVLGDRMSRLRRFQAGRLNLQLLYTVVTVLALLIALALRGWLR
jgi:hydrogenase-4 component B